MNDSNGTVNINLGCPAAETKSEIEARATRPPVGRVNLAAIPQSLRSRARWVGWHWMRRDERWTKVPTCWSHSKRTGRDRIQHAKSTSPRTWDDFEEVGPRIAFHHDHPAADPWLGIGYVLADGDGVTVVDLDDCRNRVTGEVADAAAAIVRRLDSYTEVSPSGTGLKVYVLARKPGPRCRRHDVGIEIYDRARFVAVTGERVDGTPAELADRQGEIDALYAELWPTDPHEEEERAARRSALVDRLSRPAELPDDEVIRRAMEARGGDAFARLWYGDTSDFDHDRSAADYSLACRLAFWCGPDHGRIVSLMHSSGLVRDKWAKRRDYLDTTVERAIRAQKGHYGDGQRRNILDRDEFAHLRDLDITLVFGGRRKSAAACPSSCTCRRCEPSTAPQAVANRVAGPPRRHDLSDLAGPSVRAAAADARREAEARAAAVREADAAAAEERRRRWCHNTRYKRRPIISDGKTTRVLKLRCQSWDCAGCRLVFGDAWKATIRARLGALLDDAQLRVATVPDAEWKATYQRLYRSGASYYTFSPAGEGRGGDRVVYALAPDGVLRNAEPITPADAVDRLSHAIDAYAGDRCPLGGSHDWKLLEPPPRESEFVLVGSVNSDVTDEQVAQYAERRGAEVKPASVGRSLRKLAATDIVHPADWDADDVRRFHQALKSGDLYHDGGLDDPIDWSQMFGRRGERQLRPRPTDRGWDGDLRDVEIDACGAV